MLSGTAHDIPDIERPPALDTVDTFMFRTVIHIQSADVLHQRNRSDVSHKDQNAEYAFEYCNKAGISDIFSQQVRQPEWQQHKKRHCDDDRDHYGDTHHDIL